MINLIKEKIRLSPFTVPIFLLVLCVLAYGLLIPTLGYYWDDWAYALANHRFGPMGYPDFVSLDRPYSAWVFIALTTVLGEQPLGYHVVRLLLYWLSAVLFWQLLRLLWPQYKRQALVAALLFTVYPGFLGHPQAITYQHHFFGMALYLFSLVGMVRAVQLSKHAPRRIADHLFRLHWFWHLPAVAALVVSQFTIEYFIGWETVRPVVMWLALQRGEKDRVQRIKSGLLQIIPYWLATAGFLFWRVFIFKFPTYQPLDEERITFFTPRWVLQILIQIRDAVFTAWGYAIPQLHSGEFGRPFWLTYLMLVVVSAVLVFLVLFYYRPEKSEHKEGKHALPASFGFQALALALPGIFFAGFPFWITGLSLNIRSHFYSRFTLAFIPWVALLLSALLYFLLRLKSRWVQVVGLTLTALLVGGSVGWHYWNANIYRNQWVEAQRYFQQMKHRIPGLEPGTTLVINDLQALSLYQDDSLTAILNWTYEPDNMSTILDYKVHYLSVRLGNKLPALEPGLDIVHPMRSMNFYGSTDQLLVVFYKPPGCLRILDDSQPDLLPNAFPEEMLPALPLSNLSLIRTSQIPRTNIPEHIFEPEQEDYWCLYFSEADLAAQRGDWALVADLGDQAFAGTDRPNELTEIYVFIEGYLRTDRLEMALEVSRYLSERGGEVQDEAICSLWRRVENESPEGFNLDFREFCSPAS